MYETVGYDADARNVNMTGRRVGSVSGDNSASSTPLEIEFRYDTTDAISATLGGSFTTEAGADVFIADLSTSLSFDVSFSRSWTAGTSSGARASIDPHKCQLIAAYIPLVSTNGSMKIKVYNDSTPNDFYYIYEPISAANIPARSHIHFVKTDMSPSDFQLIKNSPDPFAAFERINSDVS